MNSKERDPVLRVGLVGPLPPPFGGMANQMNQLIRLLRSEGVEVSIVQTNPDYWPKAIGKFKRVRAFFRLVPYLRKLWKLAGEVDVIHVLANSGWSWQLFATPAVWIGHYRNTPVVVNYRGGEARKYFGKAIKCVRPTIIRGDALIVPSPYLQKVFAEFGLDAKITPNIIDLDRFSPKGQVKQRADEPPHLVITRNLEPIYGISTAIRAVSILAPKVPGVRVQMADTISPASPRLKSKKFPKFHCRFQLDFSSL